MAKSELRRALARKISRARRKCVCVNSSWHSHIDDFGELLHAGQQHLGDLYAESGQTLQGSFSAAAAVDRIIFKTEGTGGVRSRLYRSQILQVNTRWKALAEICTIITLMRLYTPLHRSLISKFSLQIADFFAVFPQNFANLAITLLNCH